MQTRLQNPIRIKLKKTKMCVAWLYFAVTEDKVPLTKTTNDYKKFFLYSQAWAVEGREKHFLGVSVKTCEHTKRVSSPSFMFFSYFLSHMGQSAILLLSAFAELLSATERPRYTRYTNSVGHSIYC